MKKNYFAAAFLASMFSVTGIYGQLNQAIQTPVQHQVLQVQHQNSSPNLHHEHDGEHCLSDALNKAWIQQAGIEEQYRQQVQAGNYLANQQQSERATYTLPVIFHVIHNPNNPAENVSQNDIQALLDAVNADFSMTNGDVVNARPEFTPIDADIQFCLAMRDESNNPLTEPGIHRVTTNEDFYNPDTESLKMKSSTGGNTGTEPWNRNKYINIWVCDITNGASSGTAGYAYKPTTVALPPSDRDGIVIDYNLGMTPSNKVLTHEIGHFLGLSHTWGNSNEAAGCSEDDGLGDTPNTAGPSFDFAGSCSGNQQTCPGTETQYENFMDYSNCTVMYTANQSNLMALVLQGSRSQLTTSNACIPVNPQAPTANFIADITSVIQGGAINLTDLSSDYPNSWLWTITPAAGVTYIGGTSDTDENPVVQFANTGLYTVELTATNGLGSDTHTKTDYINVVSSGGGSNDCDTLRNYDPNGDLFTLTGAVGYVLGNENLGVDITEWAEQYTAGAPTLVHRLRYVPSRVFDGGGNVTFKVYVNNGGEPGAEIESQTVPLSTIDELFVNTVDFTSPAAVNGSFWVGYEVSYANAQDTFALLGNAEIGPVVTNHTFLNGGGWAAVDAVYSSGGNPLGTAFFLDVLTSSGSVPNAVVSFPTTETCEGMDVTMNGYGSTNTTSYYWDISDGTTDYFFDEANLTTSFPEGNWTMQLNAEGSCQTSTSGVFNLTVNPPLTGTFTTQDENCTAEDGSITFAITGGDGGALSYSINNGASIEPTNMYSNLQAGDYNYIISDDHNCEISGTVTVDNINTFSPTISADITIPQGGNTNLTVTGGNTWSWYEGNIDVGNTTSINVSPDVTTTYSCSVIDANGCEAVLEVTVTVTVGIEEQSLFNSFNVYPNPNNGTFVLDFNNLDGQSEIEVVDVIGKSIAHFKLNQSTGVKTINLTNINSGVYFVKVTSNGKTVSKKILIQK